MNACLSDRELWTASEGAGDAAEQDHLARCLLCSYRARHLEEDLAVIGRALRGPCPPGVAVGVRLSTVPLTWGAVAALVLLLGLVALGSAPLWRPSAGPVAVADGVAALTELSASIFEEDAPEIGRATDADIVATAFDSAGPCEWQPSGCEDEREPLF